MSARAIVVGLLACFTLACATLACVALTSPALAQEPSTNLRELLERLQQERSEVTSEALAREEGFRRTRAEETKALAAAQARLATAKAQAERLERRFKDNERRRTELTALRAERLGSYGELFGLVRQTARRVLGELQDSLSAASQEDDATAELGALASGEGLPQRAQLESLWLAMQNEMTAQAERARFKAKMRLVNGGRADTEFVRLGPFTALHEGALVRYVGGAEFAPLARAPELRLRRAARKLARAPAHEFAPAVIDPSRGALLELLVRTPSLAARIRQGGAIGYLILALGGAGLALALWRLVQLAWLAARVRRDVTSAPLASVREAYEEHKRASREALEAQLEAVIAAFAPRLERGLGLVKLLAGMAPLLGLLGTVTGMILTFQAVSLFGTGDAKLMAGGISQALVTTVLGLAMAIPLLLLHSLAMSAARTIVQRMEELALTLLAEHRGR